MANGRRDEKDMSRYWFRTVSDFQSGGTIGAKDEQKFLTIETPSQLQGQRIAIDAKKQGGDGLRTGPFRIGYVLYNPFAIFDEAGVCGIQEVQSLVTVSPDVAQKTLAFKYSTNGGGDLKDAQILLKVSDGNLQGLEIVIPEEEVGPAVDLADKFIATMLDYISFSKGLPIDIKSVWIRRAETLELTQWRATLPYRKPKDLDESLFLDSFSTPERLIPLLRLVREARNSTSPFYRLLCLFRAAEGLRRTIRTENNQAVKNKENIWSRPRSRIPANDFTKKSFPQWIGRSVEAFLDSVETSHRKNIAHLLINSAWQWTPDPAATKHAQQTDDVNHMLFSIIPQLIIDEWHFMQKNGLDPVYNRNHQGESEDRDS